MTNGTKMTLAYLLDNMELGARISVMLDDIEIYRGLAGDFPYKLYDHLSAFVERITTATDWYSETKFPMIEVHI